jgi:hypothetical protein
MARVEPTALENHNLARVYIAGTLREAKDIEDLLTGNGINYMVQVEPYRASILFGPRNGVAFYVIEEQATFCRAQLSAAGFHRGLLDE